MVELPGDFWSGWIIVLTAVSLCLLAWMVIGIYYPKTHEHETGKEPVWDKNLREGSAAPPLWWFWLIFAAMIFSVLYLILYPGMGSWRGMLNWTADARLTASTEMYNRRFGDIREGITLTNLTDLQNDSSLMQTAERIFLRECSACHGEDGRGQLASFPNLKDIDWQWGGSPEQIEATIRNGRTAVMVGWESSLSDTQIGDLAVYVLSLKDDTDASHPGHETFISICSACHGQDGSGNVVLGASNLTDETWIYGGTTESIETTIRSGRNGVMPAFGERLDEAQIRLLVAWLAR